MVALTGVAFRQDGNRVRMSYRWVCDRVPDRDYLCFTHALNERSEIVVLLDHAITNGRPPPMTLWARGDTAVETAQARPLDKIIPCESGAVLSGIGTTPAGAPG
jgi:hypothetical protein